MCFSKITLASNVTPNIVIIIIIKKVGSARLRESDVHPISPKTPASQYQPIDRRREIEKEYKTIVGIERIRPIKKHFHCS